VQRVGGYEVLRGCKDGGQRSRLRHLDEGGVQEAELGAVRHDGHGDVPDGPAVVDDGDHVVEALGRPPGVGKRLGLRVRVRPVRLHHEVVVEELPRKDLRRLHCAQGCPSGGGGRRESEALNSGAPGGRGGAVGEARKQGGPAWGVVDSHEAPLIGAHHEEQLRGMAEDPLGKLLGQPLEHLDEGRHKSQLEKVREQVRVAWQRLGVGGFRGGGRLATG
jgi:hypothetical protein